ncbi:hypothetical protein ACWD3I_43620 [Streptomyces sp. NPDC002817]|uniref:hypothetical protein n=1 Tax=Streptomyces sp. NPDC088357 TaxID=3154655 RepID=UPI00343F9645
MDPKVGGGDCVRGNVCFEVTEGSDRAERVLYSPQEELAPRWTAARESALHERHSGDRRRAAGTSTLLHPPHQPHRPSHPRTTDLRLFKMKEAHCLKNHMLFDENTAFPTVLAAAA